MNKLYDVVSDSSLDSELDDYFIILKENDRVDVISLDGKVATIVKVAWAEDLPKLVSDSSKAYHAFSAASGLVVTSDMADSPDSYHEGYYDTDYFVMVRPNPFTAICMGGGSGYLLGTYCQVVKFMKDAFDGYGGSINGDLYRLFKFSDGVRLQ